MNKRNPFVTSGYVSPEYFCDREKETTQILNAVKNQRNLTIFSFRRMGKTGLIHHVFQKLSVKKDYSVFYLDIQDTSDIAEFTKEFAKSVLGKFDTIPSKIIQNIGKVFANLRPSISYDSFTGEPKINLEINTESDAVNSLPQIFNYLQEQKSKVVVAIDEFQQILNYPEKNVESLLRKQIQNVKNVNFIFAGSQKHMLISMFKDHNRPFYQSTEMLHLNHIEKEVYKRFIVKKFADSQKIISELEVDYILNWAKRHTYYVQFICNRLYSLDQKTITLEIIKNSINDILNENRTVFHNYQNLLTSNQWNLLKAIAKEDTVKQITSSYFINKYKLGSASSTASALKRLVENEMVFQIDEQNYCVSDLFLSRWLSRI